MTTTMRKMVTLSMGLIFCMSVLAIPVAEAGKYSFIAKIAAKDKTQIARLAKDLPGLKSTVPLKSLSRKLNIPEHLLKSPAVRKMAVAGEEIVSHSAYAAKLLNKSESPELVIRQYMRYGKGNYIIVVEKVGKTMGKSKKYIISALERLSKKYKNMNKIINKYNAGKYDDDIVVRNIRRTGKRGMKVLGWLVEHPKTAMAGAATAWYLTDPESFEGAWHKSGQSIGTFVTETLATTASGFGEGLATGAKHVIGAHSISSIIGGGVIIALLALAFFVKTFRRILFFPFRLLGIKANKKMDNMEQKSASTAKNATSDTVASTHAQTSEQRKPRSNL